MGALHHNDTRPRETPYDHDTFVVVHYITVTLDQGKLPMAMLTDTPPLWWVQTNGLLEIKSFRLNVCLQDLKHISRNNRVLGAESSIASYTNVTVFYICNSDLHKTEKVYLHEYS